MELLFFIYSQDDFFFHLRRISDFILSLFWPLNILFRSKCIQGLIQHWVRINKNYVGLVTTRLRHTRHESEPTQTQTSLSKNEFCCVIKVAYSTIRPN